MFLRLIAKMLKVLNSEGDPWQIALAFSLAMIVGLTPLWSLHNVLIILLALVIRVNLSSFIAGVVLFTGVAYVFDPLFHRAGLAILQAEGLRELWTNMYQSPFWRTARYNNTIVMGSLAVSLAAFIPLFLVLRVLIVKYRDHLLAWIRKSRVMQMFQASKLYSLYQKVSGW